PGFTDVKKVSLRIESARTEVIDSIKLYDWLILNAKQMSKACQEYILAKDVYLIREAYRVDRATYTLRDENGVKLKLTGEKLKALLKLGADLNYKINDDGDLTISTPVYIAIRNFVFTGLTERPDALGDPSKAPDAKAVLGKYYEKEGDNAF